MDRKQAKEKERERENRADKLREEESFNRRPPFRPVWLWVLGTALVLFILYGWTVGMYR